MDLFAQSERARAVDALHAATAIYTAEPVVDDLLDRITWPTGSRRLCDPSCGDGMFIGQALRRLLVSRPDLGRRELCEVIEGWELHPYAAGQARARVARILMAHGWLTEEARSAADTIIRNRDFLTEGPPDGVGYGVIAGNPPYLRAANVPPLLRAEYEAVTPAHARADLLHSFLDRCARVLAPDGEVCMVTADRWLFNASAARLRAALGTRFGIDHLKRLDPSTAFYRPKQRVRGSPPRIHPVAVVMRRASDRSAFPLTSSAIYPDALKTGSGRGRTLADIAKVRLAPWLGPAGIFVVDEATAKRLPPECLVPAVDTDDVSRGTLEAPIRYAIKTEAGVEPPQEILEHLRRKMHRMPARGRRKCEWLPPETWTHHDLDQPSLLVPRIARSLRPVRVPAGVLPINHNLSIVTASGANLDQIERILLSDRAQKWAMACAAPLEGGYMSVTTTLLRQLPIE